MADQTLDLLIKLRADVAAGFDAVNQGMTSVRKNAQQTQQETAKFSDKMATMAGAVDMTAKKMAGLGEAAGLPAGPLRALSDVADLAEVGFSNLTKGMAGFNAASVAVVGAGLAIGTAIGSWLRTFPAVQQAADDLAASIVNLGDDLEALTETGGDFRTNAKFTSDTMKENEERVRGLIEKYKAMGMTAEQISAQFTGKVAPAYKTTAQLLADLTKEEKQATDSAKKHAEARQKLADEFERGRAAANVKHWTKFYEDQEKALVDMYSRALKKADQEGAEAAAAVLNKHILKAAEEMSGGGTSMGVLWERMGRHLVLVGGDTGKKAGKSFAESFGDTVAGLGSVIIGALQGGGDIGRAIGAHLGQSIGASLGEKLAAGMGNSLGKMLGSFGGPLGALLGGGIGGLVDKLFGGEGKRTNDLRDQFIAAAGGLDQLNKKAHDAGMTLNALLAAKDQGALQSAIDGLNSAFGVTDEATRKLNDAMREYGISVGEMGPKFAQQQLNEQATSLLEKYKLLTAAGADHNLVIDKMGPSLVEYVNQARQAGVTIPEDMRKIVEELISQGKLLDENGEAFENAEDAGVTFGASLQDSMAKAAEQMERLVEAISRLYGLGEINIPVRVHPDVSGPEGGGNRHAEHFPSGGMVTGVVPSVLHGTPSSPEYALPHDKLQALVQGAIQAALAANGGSGRPIILPPITFDGAAVTRQVTARQRGGYGGASLSQRRSRGA